MIRRYGTTLRQLLMFTIGLLAALVLFILFPTPIAGALVTSAILRLVFRQIRSRGMNGRVLVAGASSPGPEGHALVRVTPTVGSQRLSVLGSTVADGILRTRLRVAVKDPAG